jgi:hypothetical protein
MKRTLSLKDLINDTLPLTMVITIASDVETHY